jgi:hypothetical protein
MSIIQSRILLRRIDDTHPDEWLGGTRATEDS